MIIFLLCEGLPSTIIESQIMENARFLSEQGVPVEVWSFALNAKYYRQAIENKEKFSRKYKLEVRVIRGVRQIIPLSRYINGLLLLLTFWRTSIRPKTIHARTDYAASIAGTLKRIRNYRVIWDSRGDTLNEHRLKYASRSAIHRALSIYAETLIRAWIRSASRDCDTAIFVSTELHSLHKSTIGSKPYWIFPCAANSDYFNFNIELREKWRRELGFQTNDVVLIYVGSDAPWQCSTQTINLILKSMSLSPKVRALIVTQDRGSFESHIPREFSNRFQLISSDLRGVNAYLNAADIAFMLREPNKVNWVASPVKYAEYSMAGLPVVTGEAVAQVSRNGGKIGNLLTEINLVQQVLSPNIDLKRRADIALRATEIYSSKKSAESILKLYKK